MNPTLLKPVSTLVFITLILAFPTLASAQGGATSALSGVVVDTSGGVVPGADLLAKNNATGSEFHTVSDEKGIFSLPSLPPGTYTLTTTLMGFKKSVIPDVVLNVATQGTVKVTLEVGGLEEIVTVAGGVDIVQIHSSVIATTIDTKQISNLPLVSRDAINAITMLPGVDTATSNRSSTVSGLPRSAVNITIDGINTQDNNNKTTEGLFSIISPRLDAIEEVTVSTATAGAEATGQGAVQIRFVTRSGTNKFQGSAYYYARDSSWNSNYWFNNRDLPPDPATGHAPRDAVKLNEPGARLGGPIIRNKAFFFVNYEEFHQPNQVTRQRTVFTPIAMQGMFSYNAAGATRQVNLLQLAAASGQTSTLDPVVAKVMGDIRSATQGGGLANLTDPNLQRFTFTNSSKGDRYYPTVRLDYNLSEGHRVTFSTSRQKYYSTPDTLNNADPSFPGFPILGSQDSARVTWSASLRSTLSSNLVNEVHGGYTNSVLSFFPEITKDAYTGASLANTGAYSLNFNGSTNAFPGATGSNTGITNPYPGRNTQKRDNPTISVEDTMNWLHGAHSVSLGGTFTHIGLYNATQNVVPSITMGLPTGDPALPMFTTANFPGASSATLTAAQQLYALLTGHVSSVAGSAVLDENTGQYSYLGNNVSRGQMHELGFFAQDSWQARKNITLNFGVRYELQLPFVARNNNFSQATLADLYGISGVGNLFQPGVMTGRTPTFTQYRSNVYSFNVDNDNIAPSVGVTWRPSRRAGILGKLTGDEGETVIRGAYAKAYNRQGIGDYATLYGNNPGGSIIADRSVTNGTLGPVPLLLRDGSLGPPPFPSTPAYPLTGALSNGANAYDPNIQTPYTHSMSFGVQRELSRSMAIEIRYVGTRNRDGWVINNLNEANVKENGFLDEFRKAQANLQANIAAHRGSSFAYFGPNSGTSPLPIYLAFFSGVPIGQAGDPTKYTSTLWSSTNFTNPLAIYNPQPTTPAGTSSTTGLAGDPARQANSIAAGLPANFFRVNPDLLGTSLAAPLAGANLTQSTSFGKYDSMQIELRKRLSGGLQVAGSYVLANAYGSTFYSLRVPRDLTLSSGATGGIHHALKFNWVYDLPFGEGKRWASHSGLLNRIVGGWGFDGNARIQSGEILSFGNVRLVGMTDQNLRDLFKIRKDDQNRIVYILPKDIIDNTIKAFNASATSPTGYGALGPPSGRYFAPANGPDCLQVVPGDCAPREHFVTGPNFVRVDVSVSKTVALAKGVNFQFRADFLNALNNVDFVPVVPSNSNAALASATFGQVTSAYTDSSNTQDPGGRLVQLAFRLNW
jgi:hypothetical protein